MLENYFVKGTKRQDRYENMINFVEQYNIKRHSVEE